VPAKAGEWELERTKFVNNSFEFGK